ncbi:geranylgeranyl transferase type-2 subunit alpha [Phakopsora pachyrhizi]|uniref:Geranylgeranyl transferase type-2 subunit alpha n=1 Tax=Phakopsora pachyrhizi TaxID=170000 RepID=A0AAV0BFA6_PHAPC|nr:geranylgeranyl transferase type-2 subunit alpha [Phakopsora pachyrhizi]CAH7685219.1 geranylgeranyl transferase type-2 subunit alpha [Phakopsora pachyrhizi]
MHGVKRVKDNEDEGLIDPQVLREKRERLEEYKILNRALLERNSTKSYSEEDSIKLSTALLRLNPEHSTAWSFRRKCLNSRASLIASEEFDKEFLLPELELTIRSFEKNPKAYPIWEHRKWVFKQFSKDPDWDSELQLVQRFLKIDGRNFHAWDYRRHIISNLKDTKPGNLKKINEEELLFTSKEIESNFSNFSAWHYRSKLLESEINTQKQQQDKKLEHSMRDGEELIGLILKKELDWVRTALWIDPNDQSAWLYHRWLMSMTESEEIKLNEIGSIEELLKVEPDSKWALWCLLENRKFTREEELSKVLDKLLIIDPLRSKRYIDLVENQSSKLDSSSKKNVL